MIKCIAIDDEPLALKQIVSYIEKIPYMELVAACKSAAQAKKALSEGNVDVMFVDINMPDMTGMELVKSLDNPPLIVFTTAYSEYAVEGYKVEAVDYLLKPFGLEDFEKAAVKVKARLDLMATPAMVSLDDADDAIFLKSDYKVVRIVVGDILYVEGMGEYLKIFIANTKEPTVVLLSMKKLEERLPSEKFMRVHKSYIINLGKIREVTKGRVIMEGGASVPVGDMYKETFTNYLESKFLGR